MLNRVFGFDIEESLTFLKLKAIVEKDNSTIAIILGVIKRCLVT